MKTTKTLRLLSLLGFLLLLAPFYDSCDGNYIHQVNADGTESKEGKPLKTKIYDVVVNDEAFDAYQIASISIFTLENSTFKEIKEDVVKSFEKKDWYKDMGVVISFLFDAIILISFLILVLSFTKKIKPLSKWALVNSLLIVITLLYIILLDTTFDHFRQIKWGYYAFILNSLLLYYYARKARTVTSAQ